MNCDVVVVGAGITGALVADELAGHGHDVVVLDQRDVCWGSTSASTALLQYENDTHATDLVRRYDQDTALLAYQSSLDAISEIGEIARAVGDVDFDTCESLYYASNRKDHPGLVEEFAWREKHGFPVRWLNRAALKDEYALNAPSAILSSIAARVDPYRLASRLAAQDAEKRNTCIRSYTGSVHQNDRAFRSTDHRHRYVDQGEIRRGCQRLRVATLVAPAGRHQSQQLRLHHRPHRPRRTGLVGEYPAVGICAALSLSAQHWRWTAVGGWRRRRP
ncbi:FAD-binding oxidoreductase [Alcanivorax sp. JB21]|nr:FAD-binding oxidoreductase [Alcanivorax limicola]